MAKNVNVASVKKTTTKMKTSPMTTPLLLGIAGFKESGKDTAGKYLKGWCGAKRLRGKTQGLADDLKWSAALALGFKGSREECILFANSLKADGVFVEVLRYPQAPARDPRDEIDYTSPILVKISGREFLQNYGTESHRNVFGDDFWTDNLIPLDEVRLFKKWSDEEHGTDLMLMPDLMMVTDCRFPNEAERVKELNGFVLEIEKPDLVRNDNHISEKPLPRDLVDHVVLNGGNLDQFALKMMQFGNIVIEPATRAGSWA